MSMVQFIIINTITSLFVADFWALVWMEWTTAKDAHGQNINLS